MLEGEVAGDVSKMLVVVMMLLVMFAAGDDIKHHMNTADDRPTLSLFTGKVWQNEQQFWIYFGLNNFCK